MNLYTVMEMNGRQKFMKRYKQKKLGLAYEEKKILLKEEAEYYDKDDLQTYANVRNHFRGDEDRIALYFNAEEDESYQDLSLIHISEPTRRTPYLVCRLLLEKKKHK